jgi:hypothetical protein
MEMTFLEFAETVVVGIVGVFIFCGIFYLIGFLFTSENHIALRMANGFGLTAICFCVVVLISGFGAGVSSLMGLEGPFSDVPMFSPGDGPCKLDANGRCQR